jgi:sugar (pentulose or hexulose) kinase
MATRPGYLGIDAGTQGLSVIFTDESLEILAQGEADYDMVPGLDRECYEQSPADWERALGDAVHVLRARLREAGIEPDVRAIGISAQMHGEVLADADGQSLGPARLWCDGRNEAEGEELTRRFGVKVPKRLTAARWLWTIRQRPLLAARATRVTTPAGWLAWRLTGGFTLGIGDAAGMFPIDQATLDYDQRLLDEFDAVVAAALPTGAGGTGPHMPSLRDMLPVVRRAGEDGGVLDAGGAALLGLPAGIPVAPAEGDQPAALAGSLIGRPGMVAMSFGTSVCANSVGDRPFRGVSRAIDHFCAPDGRPINMVWLRNGTTALNVVVEMVGRLGGGDPFATVLAEAVTAADDCGGLAALPFMDDEPGLGVTRGGSACLVGLDAANATPGNAAKAMLLATIFNLRMGSDELDAQGFPRTEIVLSGGLTKTPALGQLLADAFATPVTIRAGAVEGTAWGAALLAKYRAVSCGRAPAAGLAGGAADWPAFLDAHATGTATRFTPRPASVATLARGSERHRRLVALHEQLG